MTTETIETTQSADTATTEKKNSVSKSRTARKLTNFAVCGGIKLSQGRMYGLRDDQEIPIQVVRGTVRGSQSHASAKLDEKLSGNIQAVDTAHLPEGCDTLRLRFQLFINRTEGYGMSSCILADVHELIGKMHQAYGKLGGYQYLAGKYVENLAKGNFLWRNRYGITAPAVTAKIGDTTYNLANAADKAAVVQAFGQALAGESVLVMQIVADVTLGLEAPVYPSEELVTDKARGQGRILAKDEQGRALMHSQKIGNALRRIDDWHGRSDLGVLPVEPYGAAMEMLDAARLTDGSFYDYLNELVKKMAASRVAQAIFGAKSIDDVSVLLKDAHYFMAILVRGGVFGGKEEEAK